jgi:hypothetical protein
MGKLTSQVKPTPWNNVSKNHHRHHPPQHPGAQKNVWEALSNLYELTFSVWSPTGHIV